MSSHVPEIILILLLGTGIAWAIYRIAKKARRGGGCCGEREEAQQRTVVRDRDRLHYPYEVQLQVTGMTCQNCAIRVENVLNAMDGVWASVDRSHNSARVLLKEKPDIPLLCQAVAKAGYLAKAKYAS